MRTFIRICVTGLAVLVVAACDASKPSQQGTQAELVATLARPAPLASLPKVQLVAPGALNAGTTPTFEWGAVADAASYRLTVLGPDAPRWAWQGSETRIRYGGVEEGVNGPKLVVGSWWSVAALGDDGGLLAVSELRSVSPGSEAGPAPTWTSSRPASTQPSAAANPAPDQASAGARACDLLTKDEIHAAIKGTWNDPELEVYPSGKASTCSWKSEGGTNLSVTLLDASSYDPAGWDPDGDVAGLGERAFAVTHGWDRRIGFVHGSWSVTLLIDYTRVDGEGFLDLAHAVDGRLP